MAIINITEWDVITREQFATMLFDSGLIVKNFDPTSFNVPDVDDILCTTSGNITHNFSHTIVNLAEDVNNIHILPKETVVVTGYENPTIGFTALNCTPEMVKFLLAFAAQSGNKITPQMVVSDSDFQNLALILKRVGGGLCAIALSNALSTGGISLTTTKGGKGTFNCTITGYGSIEDPAKIPVDYYAMPAVAVQLNAHEHTLRVGQEVTLNAGVLPAESPVTWTSDDTSKATVENGAVTAIEAGTVTITASVTADGKTASDKCYITIDAGA